MVALSAGKVILLSVIFAEVAQQWRAFDDAPDHGEDTTLRLLLIVGATQ